MEVFQLKKFLSVALSATMMASTVALAPTFSAKTVDKAVTKTSESATSKDNFTWDNASVYFLLTDRFNNGNTSNDHSYGRGLEKDGTVTTKMNSDAASFQGGDFVGITEKINEGYFDKLGVNALWVSAPYEQIQGYTCTGSREKSAMPHYAYHGYYAGDYTDFDQNFGTEEEFKTMVDTAHKHGLRVVLDIVMNHPGYNTMYDMNKFGFGRLLTGWEDEYYSFKGFNDTYHKYITYEDSKDDGSLAKDWSTWWGASWLRGGIQGYPAFGSGADNILKGSAGGLLPDFRTESTEEVELPTFLANKWKKEGNYETKVAEMNKWFKDNNKTKRVRNYLCYWLSSYVEKYGIDGFRCDTAKHVELDSWAELKDDCTKALETWRKNNPDKAGADWDEPFWMTGEVYGKALSGPSDNYFTKGKFDSTINFEFSGGRGITDVSGVNTTYEKYARNINSSSTYNVLTYISSHDTALCGRDRSTDSYNKDKLIYQGSALQLLPGAVQIYYGDETGRKYVKAVGSIGTTISNGNHDVRSFMNWDSIDNDILSHWQKVGTFRNNHVSVGAGSHTSLKSTSGAAFERTYDKDGVSDKVMACIGATANTNVTITVDTTKFANGAILKNTYDDSTATVTDGKVTFNSGANGTILIEDTGEVNPIINVKSIKLNRTSYTYNRTTKNGTLTLKATVNPTNANNKKVTYKSSNTKVATVNGNGVVSLRSRGTAIITATSSDNSKIKATCKVTVVQRVTSVKLNRRSATLKVKGKANQKTCTLKAIVNPSNANVKTVTFKSSNSKVATVNSKGKVIAKKKGRATVTVTTRDGRKTARCTIIVK
ncbi:alpha-amylase [Ruminococcus bovis]|uniref:Alpha-amylase n=2 Tax=Ruminococcus TaxID=1263 RepID=A0A4P8XTG1_9FIRM|nr:alpha-amylase [Ruminococcus bovis]